MVWRCRIAPPTFTPNLQLLRIHARIHWFFQHVQNQNFGNIWIRIPTLSHLYYVPSLQCNSYSTLTSPNPSGLRDQTFEPMGYMVTKAGRCSMHHWCIRHTDWRPGARFSKNLMTNLQKTYEKSYKKLSISVWLSKNLTKNLGQSYAKLMKNLRGHYRYLTKT